MFFRIWQIISINGMVAYWSVKGIWSYVNWENNKLKNWLLEYSNEKKKIINGNQNENQNNLLMCHQGRNLSWLLIELVFQTFGPLMNKIWTSDKFQMRVISLIYWWTNPYLFY